MVYFYAFIKGTMILNFPPGGKFRALRCMTLDLQSKMAAPTSTDIFHTSLDIKYPKLAYVRVCTHTHKDTHMTSIMVLCFATFGHDLRSALTLKTNLSLKYN